MNQFWTVFAFQFTETIRKKGFRIATLIMIAAIFGFAFLHHQGEKEDKKLDVWVGYNQTDYRITDEQLGKAFTTDYKLHTSKKSEATLKKEVKKGKKDDVIIIGEKNGVPTLTYYYQQMPDNVVASLLEQPLKQIYIERVASERGLTPDAIQDLFAPISTTFEEQKDMTKSYGLIYPLVFMMYVFILGFGQSIAVSVVSEKSSRVMEVLLPKVRPIVSLYAKIVAAFATGLLQFTLLFGSFWITRQIGWTSGDSMNMLGMSINLKEMTPSLLALFLVFFTGGFFFYGLLYATLGSMVSKVEDLNPVLTPVVFLMMGSFGLGIYNVFQPDAVLATISTYIPPFTPVVLFSRLVLGASTTMEIIGSLAIFVASFVFLTYYSQVYYKKGVSTYQTRKKRKAK